MPELPEVESYRRLAETRALGRRIVGVDAPDPWYLKGGLQPDEVVDALVGRSVVGARRRGKLLLLDLDGPGAQEKDRPAPPAVLGLRFGMSGRLVVDGRASIDRGGSHTGVLGPHRRAGGRCPRDGADLTRSQVGGRTTWWCRRHQH